MSDQSQFTSPNQQFLDSNGDPLNGGKLYFFEAGTSTKIDTFSDSAKSVANTNPIILDAAGRAGAIYMNADDYKIRLDNSSDVTIWTQDNYTVSSTSSVGGGLESASGTLRTTQTVNAQTGTSYTIVTGDRAKLITQSNASASAYTLPQADSTDFPDGWYTVISNIGVGACTITPTTSTIDGQSSIKILQGQQLKISSDGTNYQISHLTNPLAKLDATTAPTANEDSGDGYSEGSLWVDVTNDIAYICVDATSTAAVWVQLSKDVSIASTTKTDTFSTSSTTFTDVTGLSVAITPSSTAKDIHITGYVTTGGSTTNGVGIQIVRDSTAIGIGDAAGSRTRSTTADTPNGTSQMACIPFDFVDSPSTTSATTYKIQIRSEQGSGTTYVNRTSTDTDSANFGRYTSTITVKEVTA